MKPETVLLLSEATIGDRARTESRSRERHLPPVGAYRWWARRTESVFGALLDAYVDYTGERRLLVADPFAGGGVIPFAAAARGHRVYAQDLNPWPIRCLATALDLPTPEALFAGASDLQLRMHPLLANAYGTTLADGSPGEVAHTIRVVVCGCPECGQRSRLFPYSLVSLVARKERSPESAWLACRNGHLSVGPAGKASSCPDCGNSIDPTAEYGSSRMYTCQSCGASKPLRDWMNTEGTEWQPVLIQRTGKDGQELGTPSAEEVAQASDDRWPECRLGQIRPGRETRVLRSHGFTDWADIYPRRQSAVMTSLLNEIENADAPEDVRAALRLAAWGVAEMAGRLSRWDRWYLKPYEAMAGHRFNLTTLPCEINVWGALGKGRGTFNRRVAAESRAAQWFEAHRLEGLRVSGPAGDDGVAVPDGDDSWDLLLREGDSATMGLADGVVDLVLTDPPFHDDVQYDELSLPLRVWAGMPVTELTGEAVARLDALQSTCRYRDALAAVFRECRRVLRPEGHLVLSYSNRNPHAWADCLAALQEAGFRAAGSAILHSENESDYVKRGRRAGSLNLIMVLEAAEHETPLRVEGATGEDGGGDEYRFLTAVTKYFRRVGDLEGTWEEDLQAELAACKYLAPLARAAIDDGSVASAPEPSGDCASAPCVPPNQGFKRTTLRVAAHA